MRKPCKNCGAIFRPTGKYCKVCSECISKLRKEIHETEQVKKPILQPNLA